MPAAGRASPATPAPALLPLAQFRHARPLAKIIANAKGLGGTPTGQTFADVPPSSPFYLYAERLAALGTISGYGCGGAEPCDPQNRPYFRVGAPATRGQIGKIDKLTFFP